MPRAGTILRIDLSTGEIKKEPTVKYVKDYYGGSLMGLKIFSDEVPPETKPFDPQNLLLFTAGPLTGTLLGNKCEVSSKTPVQANNPYVHVGMGGQFPCEMKYAGYDHIVIKGKAKKPVYLYINNDEVEIREAQHLWGMDVWDTQEKIKDELSDPDTQVACIGPAGENMVVYALILHDINNTVAKHGMGAVMGSKNLKAVAVRGTKGLKLPDPKKFMDIFDEYFEDLTKGRGALSVEMLQKEGISRQIAEGYKYAYGVEPPDELPPSPIMDFLKRYMVRPIGCAICPVQCHELYSVPGVGNGGANCVNYFCLTYAKAYDSTAFEVWFKRTNLANKYGIDSLSVDMLAGWLMDLYSEGIITEADTDGIPFVRNNEEAIVSLIEKLAKQEGFAKMFVNGIVPAAQKVGNDTIKFADQYDNTFPYGIVEYAPDIGPVSKYRTIEVERVPGYADGFGNILAYSEYGKISPKEAWKLVENMADESAERLTGERDIWKIPKYNKKTSKMVVEKEDEVCLADVIGHCEVTTSYLDHYGISFGIEDVAKWLSVSEGIPITPDELRHLAKKFRMLHDGYNALCAKVRGEVRVESKPLNELPSFPIPGRPTDPKELNMLQDDYCKLRGYNAITGAPSKETLEKLGLISLADKLYPSSDEDNDQVQTSIEK